MSRAGLLHRLMRRSYSVALRGKAEVRTRARNWSLVTRSGHGAPGACRSYYRSTYLFYWRDFPRTVDDRGVVLVRPVEAQHQDKLSGRGRKPVALLVSARRLILNVKVCRSIRIGLQVLPSADRVPVDRIGDEEIVAVVHRDRPEAVCRWGLALRKMDNVFVGSVIRIAMSVF